MNFAPALAEKDIAAARDHFAAHGYVRVEHVLADAAAQALHGFLAEQAEWWRVVNQGEKTFDLGPESIAKLKTEGDAQLQAIVNSGAREGFQFLYDSVRVSEDAAERARRALPLDHLLDALNSEEWLATMRRITGAEDVAFVDGQATRYLPGHFLTGHDDGNPGKNRRAAYVLGLTPHWRIEWGGMLMFHGQDGDVARALMPRFNCLNLFAVPQLHSVSQVAPYAGAPRFSVTGWLRAKG